jgi:hypothetical protein
MFRIEQFVTENKNVFYPVQIVDFSYIFDNSLRNEGHFLRPGGPFFEAWRATFGPRATGWEPLF